MELIRKIIISCKSISSLAFLVWITIVDCTVSLLYILSHNFHTVNLTTSWPLSIYIFICCHKPEGWKIAHSLRHLGSYLKKSVCKVSLILCVDSTGSIRDTSVFVCFLNRINIEVSVFNADVLL